MISYDMKTSKFITNNVFKDSGRSKKEPFQIIAPIINTEDEIYVLCHIHTLIYDKRSETMEIIDDIGMDDIFNSRNRCFNTSIYIPSCNILLFIVDTKNDNVPYPVAQTWHFNVLSREWTQGRNIGIKMNHSMQLLLTQDERYMLLVNSSNNEVYILDVDVTLNGNLDESPWRKSNITAPKLSRDRQLRVFALSSCGKKRNEIMVSGYIRIKIFDVDKHDEIVSDDIVGIIALYYVEEVLHCFDWSGYEQISGLIGSAMINNDKLKNEHRMIHLSHIFA